MIAPLCYVRNTRSEMALPVIMDTICRMCERFNRLVDDVEGDSFCDPTYRHISVGKLNETILHA